MAAGEAGKVVLYLHGIGASSGCFRFLFQGLGRATRIIAPHAPGEFLSDPFSQHAPRAEDYADAAAAFLDALGIAGPVHVIGSSFGAMTGAMRAARHPGRVDRLVLIGASRGQRWKSAAARAAMLARRAASVADVASAIHAPTLVLTGAEDGVNPPAIGDASAAAIGGHARVVNPAGIGHLPQLPAVPRLAEACFPQIGPRTWFGVLAPAATPLALRRRIAADIRTAMAAPAVADRHLTLNGYTVHASRPEAFAAFIVEDLAYTLRLIRAAGITAS
jgi:pimeloyl-ACP methyl ester carboxylesterase